MATLYQHGDSHSGGKIISNAWFISEDGKLAPCEFYFSPLGKDQAADFGVSGMKEFLREFMERVKEKGLDKTVALRLFSHKGYTEAFEITEGRANFNLLPGQVSGLL